MNDGYIKRLIGLFELLLEKWAEFDTDIEGTDIKKIKSYQGLADIAKELFEGIESLKKQLQSTVEINLTSDEYQMVIFLLETKIQNLEAKIQYYKNELKKREG